MNECVEMVNKRNGDRLKLQKGTTPRGRSCVEAITQSGYSIDEEVIVWIDITSAVNYLESKGWEKIEAPGEYIGNGASVYTVFVTSFHDHSDSILRICKTYFARFYYEYTTHFEEGKLHCGVKITLIRHKRMEEVLGVFRLACKNISESVKVEWIEQSACYSGSYIPINKEENL